MIIDTFHVVTINFKLSSIHMSVKKIFGSDNYLNPKFNITFCTATYRYKIELEKKARSTASTQNLTTHFVPVRTGTNFNLRKKFGNQLKSKFKITFCTGTYRYKNELHIGLVF